LVQLSYAIVVATQYSLSVVTYDAECGKPTDDDITNIVMIEFDCRLGAFARHWLCANPITRRS
jgi:S-adenosylmethionine synthetase